MVKSHGIDSLWGPVRNSGSHIIDGLYSVIWYTDIMQLLCIWNDFNLSHISQNNDWSECVCNSGNVCDSGEGGHGGGCGVHNSRGKCLRQWGNVRNSGGNVRNCSPCWIWGDTNWIFLSCLKLQISCTIAAHFTVFLVSCPISFSNSSI